MVKKKQLDFKVKFMIRSFDFRAKQGLGVKVGSKRYAFALFYNSTAIEVANSLRKMADWITAQSEIAA